MKQPISVDKALKRGQLMVNLPVMICLFGTPSLSLYLYHNDRISMWHVAILCVTGFILAWLVWSFMITKWRIWAFENVDNVHDLKKRAVEEKLIWQDGHFFEKTEIRSKADQEKLEIIESKFRMHDVFEEDHSIPDVTKIYYSKPQSILKLCISVLLFGVAIYLLSLDHLQGYLIGGHIILIALYYIYKSIKIVFNTAAQITIDTHGIKIKSEAVKTWYEIFEEQVIKEGTGHYAESFLLYYDEVDTHIKINIDKFNVTHRRLETILRTYRMRHTAINKL